MASKRDTGKDIADNTKKSAKFEKDAKDALNKIANLQDKYMKFYSLDRRNMTPWKRKEVAARTEMNSNLKKLQNDMKKVKDALGVVEKETKKKNKKDSSGEKNTGGKDAKDAKEETKKGFKGMLKGFAKTLSPLKMKGKDKGEQTGNAMKDAMKFAVGGSIVGMLGKKLFDSSPILKTMMSLFNTSIMLIFRPIGDFIGSFLRPIMLFFMKNIAIPFYKNSKHAMGLGEQYGKQALGFLLKPAETIHAAIVSAMADNEFFRNFLSDETVNRARDYDGMAHWQLDQLKEAGMDPSNQFDKAISKHGWTHMKGLIADVWTGGKEKQGGQMWGTTPGASSMPGAPAATVEEYFAEVETNAEASAGHMEEVETFMARALIDGQLIESEWDELQEIMGRAVLAGVDIKNSMFFIKDEMEKSGARLSSRWEAFKTSNLNAGKGIHSKTVGTANDAINMWKTGIFSTATGTNFDINTSSKPASPDKVRATAVIENLEKRADTTNTQTVWNKLQEASLAGRFEGKNEQETAGLFQALVRGGSQVGVEGQRLLDKWKKDTTVGGVKGVNDKEARKHAAAYSAAMTLYNMHGGTKPQMGDLTNIVNGKPAGSVGYANGGLITEPIFGIGRSGQTYTFGERGQETVTPGKGGTNYILNINVGNVTREADFDKLKPLIQRWILEANSRRGVV